MLLLIIDEWILLARHTVTNQCRISYRRMEFVTSVGVSITVVCAFILCAVYYRVLNAIFVTLFSSDKTPAFERSPKSESAVISYDTRVDGTPKKLYVSYNSRKNLCLRHFTHVEVFDSNGTIVLTDNDVVAYSIVSPWDVGMYMFRFIHEDEEDDNIVLVASQVLYYDQNTNTISPGLTVPVSCLPQQSAVETEDSTSSVDEEEDVAERNEDEAIIEEDAVDENVNDQDPNGERVVEDSVAIDVVVVDNSNVFAPKKFSFAEALHIQLDQSFPVVPPYNPPVSCGSNCSVNLLASTDDSPAMTEDSIPPVAVEVIDMSTNDTFTPTAVDVENPAVELRKRNIIPSEIVKAEFEFDTPLSVVTVSSD